MVDDPTRLKAAIAAIHDHLHAGRVNEAHKACECAMTGGEVSQPNLTLPNAAKAQMFAASFNELAQRMDVAAAFLLLMPSSTVQGATSFQVGGQVDAAKIIEAGFNRTSIYQGEHSR